MLCILEPSYSQPSRLLKILNTYKKSWKINYQVGEANAYLGQVDAFSFMQ